MASLVDACIFVASSAGTGDFVVAAARPGWRTPAQAGATDAATYRYRAFSTDQTEWEIGSGVYDADTATLTRAIVSSNSLGTTSKMDFAAAPSVALTAFAADFPTPAQLAKVDFLTVTDDVDLDEAVSDISGLITDVGLLETSKSDVGHTHAISDVTNLQTTLNGKAATSHTHAISDVTNLQTTLDGKDLNPQITGLTAATIVADGDYMVFQRISGPTTLKVLWSQFKAWVKAYTDTLYATTSHTHAFSAITSKPTTVSGYGITDGLTDADVATATQIRDRTANKVLDTDGVGDAAIPPALSNWTGAVTVNFNSFLSSVKVNLTANATLGATSNVPKGYSGVFEVTQVGGPWTIALNATYWATSENKGLTLGTGLNIISWLALDNGKVFLAVAGKAVA